VPVITLVSAKGSPGVTTAAASLTAAATIEGSALLVELDPSGGDVQIFTGSNDEPGVVRTAGELRRDVSSAAIGRHTSVAPADVPVLLAPTAGLMAASVIGSVLDRWDPALAQHGGTVFVDAGRWDAGQPTARRVALGDLVAVVCRPSVASVEHTRHMVDRLREVARRPVVALVVGTKPYAPAEVAAQLELPLGGAIAWDPRGTAALWAKGVTRSWGRTWLASSAAHSLEMLVDHVGRAPARATVGPVTARRPSGPAPVAAGELAGLPAGLPAASRSRVQERVLARAARDAAAADPAARPAEDRRGPWPTGPGVSPSVRADAAAPAPAPAPPRPVVRADERPAARGAGPSAASSVGRWSGPPARAAAVDTGFHRAVPDVPADRVDTGSHRAVPDVPADRVDTGSHRAVPDVPADRVDAGAHRAVPVTPVDRVDAGTHRGPPGAPGAPDDRVDTGSHRVLPPPPPPPPPVGVNEVTGPVPADGRPAPPPPPAPYAPPAQPRDGEGPATVPAAPAHLARTPAAPGADQPAGGRPDALYDDLDDDLGNARHRPAHLAGPEAATTATTTATATTATTAAAGATTARGAAAQGNGGRPDAEGTAP
jgi:hypothetical protein